MEETRYLDKACADTTPGGRLLGMGGWMEEDLKDRRGLGALDAA
jgi:hypothetical protein